MGESCIHGRDAARAVAGRRAGGKRGTDITSSTSSGSRKSSPPGIRHGRSRTIPRCGLSISNPAPSASQPKPNAVVQALASDWLHGRCDQARTAKDSEWSICLARGEFQRHLGVARSHRRSCRRRASATTGHCLDVGGWIQSDLLSCP